MLSHSGAKEGGLLSEWERESSSWREGGKVLREGGEGRTEETGVLKEQTRGTEEEKAW